MHSRNVFLTVLVMGRPRSWCWHDQMSAFLSVADEQPLFSMYHQHGRKRVRELSFIKALIPFLKMPPS